MSQTDPATGDSRRGTAASAWPAQRNSTLLDAARQLEPLIRRLQPRIEHEQTLPREVVDGLVEAGVFRTHAPKAIGGLEVDLLSYLEVVEALSRMDASVGWLAMINCGNFFSWFPPEVSGELFRLATPYTVCSGNLAPKGRATPVPGGYRVSGRWAFVSGIPHADLVLLRSPIEDNPSDVIAVVLPRGQFEIVATWNGLGLRGTGSHDVTVDDVFVPTEHTTRFDDYYPGPLYKAWFFLLGHAAHATGIARTAIEALIQLSRSASPRAGALHSRPEVQMALAEAEATLAAARAYVWDICQKAWTQACSDEPIETHLRMQLRLANMYCVRACAHAVKLVYDAAGPPSVYEGSTLERCFRDSHTITQHTLIQTFHYQAIGHYLFNGETPTGRAVI